MSPAMKALLRQRDDIMIDSLNRMRAIAPRVYDFAVQRLQTAGVQPHAGLGAVEDWTEFGKGLVDTYLTVRALKEISEEERKAADQELRKIQEQNAAIEKQLMLQNEIEKTRQQSLTLQQRASIAGESLLDQFLAKPWAVPTLIGLGFAWFRTRKSNRRG